MKKLNWFKKTGLFYVPVSMSGYIISLIAIIFMVPILMAITRNGHSVSDDLYEIFIYGTATFFWWNYLAERTSIQDETKTN
jgi:hypothetical protein